MSPQAFPVRQVRQTPSIVLWFIEAVLIVSHMLRATRVLGWEARLEAHMTRAAGDGAHRALDEIEED